MSNPLSMNEYDKVVRRFVDDYVNNLTPDQMREIISEQSHIDFENLRQDCGQSAVFDEMSSWDSDVFDEIAEDYPILSEDTEGWTDEDFKDYYKETFIDINNTGGKY